MNSFSFVIIICLFLFVVCCCTGGASRSKSSPLKQNSRVSGNVEDYAEIVDEEGDYSTPAG